MKDPIKTLKENYKGFKLVQITSVGREDRPSVRVLKVESDVIVCTFYETPGLSAFALATKWIDKLVLALDVETQPQALTLRQQMVFDLLKLEIVGADIDLKTVKTFQALVDQVLS